MFVQPLKDSIYDYWKRKTLDVLKPCIKENPDNKIKLNNIQDSFIVKFRGVQYAGELDMECLKELINCYKKTKSPLLTYYLKDFFKKFNVNSKDVQSKFSKIIKDVEDKLLSKSFLHNFNNVSREFSIQNVSNSVFILFYDIRGPLSDLFVNALQQTENKKKFDNIIENLTSNSTLYFMETLGILLGISFITLLLSFLILFGKTIWRTLI